MSVEPTDRERLDVTRRETRRPIGFTVWLTTAEARALADLAARFDLNKAATLRWLLLRASEDL